MKKLFKGIIMKRPRTKRRKRKTKGNDLLQYLPQDVLVNHIFNRLDFSSRVRARGVSPAWRDLYHLPLIPWVCANNDRGVIVTAARATSQCIPVVHLRKPMLDVIGSHGQYVIANHREPEGIISLIYNPFTGKSFPLPKTSRFYRGDGSYTAGPMNLPLRLAIMSSPPTSTAGESVVAAMDQDDNLCVCRLGVDQHWISSSPKCHCVTDILFHGGELCVLSLHESFKSTNVAQLFRHGGPRINYFNATYRLLFEFEEEIDFNAGIYLSCRHMVSSLGELLLVTIYRRISAKRKICSFQVHRIEGKESVPIDDLGDRMLFVGRGCSMSQSGKEFNQSSSSMVNDGFFSSNCIYYVSWCDCHNYWCANGVRGHDCPRDKVRVRRLWKLSLLNHRVVGPVLFYSIGPLMWITSPPTGRMHELTR